LADPGAVNRLAQSGESLLSRIFGNGFSGIVDALAGQSGVSRASATKLLGLSAPIVLDIVGREATTEDMDASGLSRFLDDQSQSASGALPVSMSSALAEARRQIEVPSQARQQEWRPGDPRETPRETFEGARGRAGGAFGAARQRMSGAMGDVRERAHTAGADIRHRARGAADKIQDRRAVGATAGAPERKKLSGMTWLLAAIVLVGLLAFLIARARRTPESSLAPETDVPRLGTPEGRPIAPPAMPAPRTPAAPPEPETKEAPPAGLPEPARKAAAPEPATAPPESTIGEAEPAAQPPAAAGEIVTLSEGSGTTMLSGFLESNEPPPKRFVLEIVSFGTGAAGVNQSKVLDAVADTMREHPGAKIRLDGYTDATGAGQANRRLSKQRADSVKKYLVERGVASERIETAGKGESAPLDTSASPEANAKNRRVELVVISR
jgi:outer membrane protein OmpA-like peptidoglycan-associated protein